MSIVILVSLLASAGAHGRALADASAATTFRKLTQVSSTSGLPTGVTLVPERPIGSPWLYSPNVTALNAYLCPGTSVVESLTIVNGSVNNSPGYNGVPNWPSTIASVQANCSLGNVLPVLGLPIQGSFYGTGACVGLGYGYFSTKSSVTYTGSVLRNFAQNFTYREGRLIYQINGQGSTNGTSGFASCPSGEVIVGYSGLQICEGVGLLQFACANETSSRGEFNSSQPFNLTTPVSQRYVGRQLPNGTSLTSLGTQDDAPLPSSLPAPQGLPSSITLVPPQAIGSPWLFSPNISAARAYICQETTYLAFLTLGSSNSNSNQQNPLSSITSLQGTCSDGSVLPAFYSNTYSPLFQQYCAPLGYPSTYTVSYVTYSSLSLSILADQFTYKADRIFSALDGSGGGNGTKQYAACPRGQKVVGYAGLETCDGPDVIQFACASLEVSRGTFNSTQPIYLETAVSLNYSQIALPSGVNSKFLSSEDARLAPGPSPFSQLKGVPGGVTLVPSTTLTSPYLNSPNTSAARAFICQGDTYLAGLTVSVGSLTNSSDKTLTLPTFDIHGNCSDGTSLPGFSTWTSISENMYDKYCPHLAVPYGYNFFVRTYTFQDAIWNLSSLAQRFTYRGDRILWQFNGQGTNYGSLKTGSCPSQQQFVGYAGLDTCDGPSRIQMACADLSKSRGAFDPLQPIYLDTQISLQYVQKVLPPEVNSSFLPSAGPSVTPGG